MNRALADRPNDSQEQRRLELLSLDWHCHGWQGGVYKLSSPTGAIIAYLYPDHTHREINDQVRKRSSFAILSGGCSHESS